MKITITTGDAIVINEDGTLDEIKIEDTAKNNYNFDNYKISKFDDLVKILYDESNKIWIWGLMIYENIKNKDTKEIIEYLKYLYKYNEDYFIYLGGRLKNEQYRQVIAFLEKICFLKGDTNTNAKLTYVSMHNFAKE